MAIEKLPLPEVLELGKLNEVLQSPGPCTTLVLPPHHPGERAESAAAFLKTSLQSIAQQFADRRVPKAVGIDVVAPLEHLAEDSGWSAGSHLGSVILRSPEVFCQFQLTQPVRPSLTVAGCFAIRRLLGECRAPKVFYILPLSKESVGLFRCAASQAEAVELPERTPMTLEGAMEFEPPDHDLENRSASGSSAGARSRIRFGTGSGRETAHAHLADFYKLVDRGVHQLLRESEIPLLLAGVDEDLVAYRAVNTYRRLAKASLHGSANLSSPEAETVVYARSLLRAEEREREAQALKEITDRTAPDRLLTDPHAIINAAFDGRVRQLYVNESAEVSDVFERGNYRTWGKEDLLNLSAVQTLLHRGSVFELSGNTMPSGAAAVAMLRY
jgi:hypothetical protein